MIKVGQKVRFNPFKDLRITGIGGVSGCVTGTVVSVHASHHWFGVEYKDGDHTWRTSFKFEDVGEHFEIVE